MNYIIKYILITLIITLNNLTFAENNQKIHSNTLKNGLKVIVKIDNRSPIFVSQVWYKVGSSYEHDGITGISHMLEHMMFKESKNLKDGEFTKIIDTNGGVQNAFTTHDFTAYYEVLKSDKLDLALKLEAERMRNLTLNKDAFEKEKQVVLEERRMRIDDKPYSHLYERLLAASYISNPYHHPVIGWPEDIKQYTVEDIKSWYNKWYYPNNAILVVVGDVNPKEVFNLANKHFGKINKNQTPILKNRSEIQNLGTKNIEVQLPAKVPMVMLSFMAPNVSNISEEILKKAIKDNSIDKISNFKDAITLEMISAILSNDNSSRLPKSLVRESKVATSAGSQYDSFGLHKGLFVLHGIPTAKTDVKILKKAILKELKNLIKESVSNQEIEKIKNQIISNKVYSEDDISNQAIQIGSLESLNVTWRFYEIYLQELQKITAEDIKAVAKKYFIDKNLTVAYLKPLDMEDHLSKRKQQTIKQAKESKA